MSLRRVSPAPYHALAAMLAAEPAVRDYGPKLGGFGAARFNLAASGLSFGVHDGAACVACAGFASRGPGHYEAWFVCAPALAPRLRAFVRLAQLTLRELPQDATVEARVAPGWTPGERLAALLGFRHADGDLWTLRDGTAP